MLLQKKVKLEIIDKRCYYCLTTEDLKVKFSIFLDEFVCMST